MPVLAATCATAGPEAPSNAQPDHNAKVHEYIDFAVRNNPRLEAIFQNWQSARETIALARGFDNPIIGVALERANMALDDYRDIEWSLRQRLPGFGKRAVRESAADLEAEVAGLEYLEAARALRAQVAAAYWDLWATQKAVSITRTNRHLLYQVEQTARARYESGDGSQQNVLRAQIALATIENDVETRMQDSDLAKVKLNVLLNLPQDRKRRTQAEPYISGSHMELISAHILATTYCPKLLAYERMILAEKSRLRLAKLEGVPGFEARIQARQFKEGSGIDEVDTALFLSIPWLWRGQRKAAVKKARAGLELAEADYESAANTVLLDVTSFHHHAETAQRTLELHRDEIIPRAKKAVTAAMALYQTGGGGFFEFIEAQRILLDAHLGYYDAVATVAAVNAQLDRFISPFDESVFKSERDPSEARYTR